MHTWFLLVGIRTHGLTSGDLTPHARARASAGQAVYVGVAIASRRAEDAPTDHGAIRPTHCAGGVYRLQRIRLFRGAALCTLREGPVHMQGYVNTNSNESGNFEIDEMRNAVISLMLSNCCAQTTGTQRLVDRGV